MVDELRLREKLQRAYDVASERKNEIRDLRQQRDELLAALGAAAAELRITHEWLRDETPYKGVAFGVENAEVTARAIIARIREQQA